MNNPEVMMEIQTALESKMETIQAERLKVALKESAGEIFRRPNAPTAGNPSGDVTIVEFFDYNCGYCKRAFGDVAKIVEKDPKVKVVFKELPILSKGSEEGAKVALAAKLQGKYWEAHRALIGLRGEINEQTALGRWRSSASTWPSSRRTWKDPRSRARSRQCATWHRRWASRAPRIFWLGTRPLPAHLRTCSRS